MRKRNGDGHPNPTKTIWILIDTSNSNARSRNYLWWFETKKLAEEYKHWQNETYRGPGGTRGATLVGPFKYNKG
jgi:hypothetical protein